VEPNGSAETHSEVTFPQQRIRNPLESILFPRKKGEQIASQLCTNSCSLVRPPEDTYKGFRLVVVGHLWIREEETVVASNSPCMEAG
jgi:hypothetical protein